MTPVEMETHIVELCRRHGIAYLFREKARRAAAMRIREGASLAREPHPRRLRARRGAPYQRAIVCPTIKSARSYFTALHELGHHLGYDQRDRRIVQEIGAWEWALENARSRVTPGVRKMIARSLTSYVIRYTRGHGYGAKQAWLPSEQDRPDVYARLCRLVEGRC